MKFLMERPALFNAALWAAPMVRNGLPRFMKYNDFDDWGQRTRTAGICQRVIQRNVEEKRGTGKGGIKMSSREEILASIRKHTQTRYEKTGYSRYETFDVSGQNGAILRYQPCGRRYGSGIGRRRRCGMPSFAGRYRDTMRIASVLPDISCATFNPDMVDDPKNWTGRRVAVIQGEIR